MIASVQANVLTIGLHGKGRSLRQLPVRLITTASAKEATRCFKGEKIDTVVSKWHLIDMRDGVFLRSLRKIKPKLPIITFINSGDVSSEIAARSLGVSAVLTDDDDDYYFVQTVANILGLEELVSVKSISSVDRFNRDYAEVDK